MTYLLDHAAETERLRLQSRVWEPAGRRLLDLLGDGTGSRVLDVGCGVMGWLRLLSDLNPLTYVLEAVRPLFAGSYPLDTIGAGLLASALVAALGLVVGLRAMKAS